MRSLTWPYSPLPPACRAYFISPSATRVAVSLNATCGRPTVADTSNSRLSRSTTISRCCSPAAKILTSPLAASVLTARAGSSRIREASPRASFRPSPSVFGITANESSGVSVDSFMGLRRRAFRLEPYPVAELGPTPESGRRDELFDQDAAVGLDDAPRRVVARAGGELDVAKPFRRGLVQHLGERAGGVTAAPLPGHDRVAEVTEAVRRQRLRAGLPAETNRAAELAVPDPLPVPGQPLDRRSVGKHDRLSRGLAIDQAGDEGVRIGGDARQLLVGSRLSAHVIGRPAAP